MLLNCLQYSRRVFLCAAFALTLLSGGALAQDSTKATSEKWRPKEGTYAEPGTDFSLRCGEFGDFIGDLTHNSISGSEWSCKIRKLTDTAPGAIRLDMTCSDYNLALSINARDP